MIQVDETISIGNIELQIVSEDASVDDQGRIEFKRLTLEHGDNSRTFTFEEPAHYHELKSSIINRLLDAIDEDQYKDHVYGDNVHSPSFLQEDTQRAEVLEAVADNNPVTSSDIQEITGVEYASSELAALSDKDLVSPVAKQGSSHVYSITPRGMTEVIAHRDGEIDPNTEQKGLDALFEGEDRQSA